MSLVTPTTKQISDNIIAQLEASFNQTIPLLPKSFFRVLAKTFAGVFVLIYKYAGFTFLQMFVQTASIKDTSVLGVIISPLKFWGRLSGVGDPVPAVSAELTIDITVNVQSGFLPSGTPLLNSDNGITYITVGTVPLNAPIVFVNILASSDQAGGDGSGAIGNLSVSDVVSFANPLANVDRDAVVSVVITTGADGESTELYRQRVIDRFQKLPQGGALADYELWGEEVAGIVNIFPYTSDCPGQIDVYVEATVASSGDPDGIPTASQLQAVLDNINTDMNGLASRRPANALVNTFPITRIVFDVIVDGLAADDLSKVQADITTAVTDYFLDKEPLIIGLSVLPRRDRITRNGVGGAVDDIVNAAGGVVNLVTVTESSVVIEIFSLGIGQKAKLGTLSFT